MVRIANWVIKRIREHIATLNVPYLPYRIIRIDKPAPLRVIVPALQIVQPRFRVVDVSAVAQGILFAEGGGQRAGGGQRIAPCVVGVGHDARAAGADETGHIALCVPDVEILRAVVVHGQRAGRVVGEVQLIAAPRQLHQLVAQIMVIVGRAVDSLRDALAVGIVAVGDIRPGLAHPCELAAVLPCIRPRAVAQEVADLVRRQALAADVREQIAPARARRRCSPVSTLPTLTVSIMVFLFRQNPEYHHQIRKQKNSLLYILYQRQSYIQNKLYRCTAQPLKRMSERFPIGIAEDLALA